MKPIPKANFGKEAQAAREAERLQAYHKFIHELVSLERTLKGDVKAYEKLVFSKATSQTACRAYVRAVFALIEGGIFGLRQLALNFGKQSNTLTPAEFGLLQEKGYDVNEKGQVVESTKHIRFVNNIKFVFTTHARVYGVTFKLDVQDPGSHALVEALKVRHRITHPKKADELSISAQELKLAKEAAEFYTWSRKQVSDAIVKYREALMERIKDRREHSQRPFAIRE